MKMKMKMTMSRAILRARLTWRIMPRWAKVADIALVAVLAVAVVWVVCL